MSKTILTVQRDQLAAQLVQAPDGQGIVGFQNGYLLLGANID